MRTLVLGGYGAVDARVVAELRSGGQVAVFAGRERRRAGRVVDLGDDRSDRAALDDVAVVNASGIEDAALAVTTDRGGGFVDVTATTAYVAALEGLRPRAPVLISVGLDPGLTNLLAATLHASAPGGAIDLVVLLGAGERQERRPRRGRIACWASRSEIHRAV